MNNDEFIKAIKDENLVELTSMANARRLAHQVSDKEKFLEQKRRDKVTALIKELTPKQRNAIIGGMASDIPSKQGEEEE